MTRKTYRYAAVILAAAIVLSLSIFATGQTSFAEAKAYLQSYSEHCTNTLGKGYTLSYTFQSEEELNELAEYVASIGISAFEAQVDNALDEQGAGTTSAVRPRYAEPDVVYETISGNGSHHVSASANGYASFDRLGEGAYTIELDYYVKVQNGVMVSVTNPGIDIDFITPNCEWGDVSLPSYCTDYSCGITANYTISKSLMIDVNGYGLTLTTETDREILSLLTTLEH